MSAHSQPSHRFLHRYGFHLAVGSFVLLSSFLYGISVGLSRSGAKAHAGNQTLLQFDTDVPLTRIVLPAGVAAVPLGRDVQINGRAAEVVSFVSDRPAIELVREQTEAWQRAGVKTIGTAGDRRGFVVGVNPAMNERYAFSAWTVPPALRNQLSGGKAVQGTMTVADAGAKDATQDGTVPEVPLRPGGRGGAVFSSADPGGRSYSSVYTNPGSVGENIEFYRTELAAADWREASVGLDMPDRASYEVGNLVFRRGSEELVLLLSPSRGEGETMISDETVISVTRGPAQLERYGAP